MFLILIGLDQNNQLCLKIVIFDRYLFMSINLRNDIINIPLTVIKLIIQIKSLCIHFYQICNAHSNLKILF